jgi:tetratricopeptide (TPR) repeat protein
MPNLKFACRVLATFFCLAPLGFAALDPAAFKAAVELYQQRKQSEAQKAFEALAAADPQNADIQFYLGRIALQRGIPEMAVAALEKAVALSPNDSRFHHRLGDAYGQSAQKAGVFSKMGLAGKCRTAYEKAVELDPKNLDARSSLMNYYQQAPGIAGGSKDKALGQAQEIKKLDASRGRFAFATLYLAEKKYPQAFAEFEEVLKEKPDDYAALFQTGRLAALSGERLDHGLTVLRQCLTMPPPEGQPGHAAAHWRIGFILEKKDDKAGARAAYEASLKLDPKFPQAIESLRKL